MDDFELDSDLRFIQHTYSAYRDIIAHWQTKTSSCKEKLNALAKLLDLKNYKSETIIGIIQKIMETFELSVNSQEFSCFYNFVFFICRENGQKSVPVNMAIDAWRIVLSGRFRLLSHWCDYIKKTQRHNISEDTWHQVLIFSRCINENLDDYDPEGAWPVLIDEFVDHMYSKYRTCLPSTSRDLYSCIDGEMQPDISSMRGGLKLLPGSKRKSMTTYEMEEISYTDKSLSLTDISPSDTIMHTVVSNNQRQMRKVYSFGSGKPIKSFCR
ncbi:DCN1-like protein [Zostera marina]|uniref:Defective in cullin neddylation protein n=1 Tax=Zostera marina TaxID=29655 RepID=A0A0K9PEW4_ZOSMR|nr:DCN1-like protein [Zostera marina]